MNAQWNEIPTQHTARQQIDGAKMGKYTMFAGGGINDNWNGDCLKNSI